MSFLHNVGTCAIGLMVIFHNFFVMEKYLNTSLYADCSSHVYDCGRRPPGASMPPNLA